MVRLIEFRFDSINQNRKFRFFPALCMLSGPLFCPSASYRQRVTPFLVHWASPSPRV